jgi:hypothetical protein
VWVENPYINVARGGSNPIDENGKFSSRFKNYWIEDRVDLTLLEIKKAIEKGGDLCNRNIQGSNMEKWLGHFGSFKKYVEFFCFEPFVDTKGKYTPFDITQEKENGSFIAIDESEDYKDREKHTIFRLSDNQQEIMFKNLTEMIQARSVAMQERL